MEAVAVVILNGLHVCPPSVLKMFTGMGAKNYAIEYVNEFNKKTPGCALTICMNTEFEIEDHSY